MAFISSSDSSNCSSVNLAVSWIASSWPETAAKGENCAALASADAAWKQGGEVDDICVGIRFIATRRTKAIYGKLCSDMPYV